MRARGHTIVSDIKQQPPSTVSAVDGRSVDKDWPLPAAAGEATLIAAFLPGEGSGNLLRAYGLYLSELLGGQITFIAAEPGKDLARFKQAASHFDLVLCGTPQQSIVSRLLFGSGKRRLASKAPTSILLAQEPRWPIQKILLVVRVEAVEAVAVDWAALLTRASGAHLTILPLIPPQPLMYGPESALHIGIDSLLAPDTPCGEQLRGFLKGLHEGGVDGTLRVRQGDPLWQMCWEIDEGNYDLIVISAEPRGVLPRWLFGDLVGPLISRVGRPLLIASPKQFNRNQSGSKRLAERAANDR